MNPQEFLARYEAHKQAQQQAPNEERLFVGSQFALVVKALTEASQAMQKFMESYHGNVSVDNFPDKIKTPDTADVVKAISKLEKTLKPVKADNSDLVKSIKAVETSVKAIPKPDAPSDTVEISNLKEVLAGLSSVQKAVEKLDLKPNIKVDAPKIPEPKVTVQPTDVSGIIKALDKVKKAVDTKPIPVANTPTDPLIYYLPADIDDLGAVQYFGYTDNKGAWYVRKFDTSVSPKTLRFSFGQSNYTTNWTNRASLTYSVWGS